MYTSSTLKSETLTRNNGSDMYRERYSCNKCLMMKNTITMRFVFLFFSEYPVAGILTNTFSFDLLFFTNHNALRHLTVSYSI